MLGLGPSELLAILVIALIVFGPRKLPDLGKSLGQAMAKFRNASNDFKQTWEQEVESETYKKTLTTSTDTSYSSGSTESSESENTTKTEANTETASVEPALAGSSTNSEKKNWI